MKIYGLLAEKKITGENAMSYISAPDAVHRGTRMVYIPSMAAMFGPWIFIIVLFKAKVVPSIGYEGLPWFATFFLMGFIGGWLVWSIQIPRWRLWAYQNVRDIEELKKQAVLSGLIWSDGHFLEKTEIMTAVQRAELIRLEAENRKRASAPSKEPNRS